MSFKLVPRSPLAVKLLGDRRDWALDPSTLTSLGRAANSTILIPGEWVQFSSSHLRLWAEQRPDGGWAWHMQDSSTNGTWLTAPLAADGVRPGKHRVPKGHRMVLEAGSIIHLSTAPSEVLEFEFVREDISEDDQNSATQSTDGAAEHHQHKRKSRDTGLSSSAKRPHLQQQQQQQQQPHAASTTSPPAAAAAAAQPLHSPASPAPCAPARPSTPPHGHGHPLPHGHGHPLPHGQGHGVGHHAAPPPSNGLPKRSASVSGTPPPTTGNGLMAAHQHTMTAPPLGAAPMVQSGGSNSDSLKEAKRLADRNQELRRTKEELTAQLEEAKQRAGDLSAQLEEARRLQAETEGKLADYQAEASGQIGALESKLEAEAKSHQETESALARTKGHALEERAEAERLRNEVWQLRTDIGGLRNQVAVMEQQRTELEARAAADAAAHASLQADLHTARATTAAHTEALMVSTRTISERERERNKAVAELAVLHTQVESLKSHAADMATTELDLRKQLQQQEGTSQERLDLLSVKAMENASVKKEANSQIDNMVKALTALKHGVIASLSTEVGCADSAQPSGAAGAPDAHAGTITPMPLTNDTSGPQIPYTSAVPGMATPAHQQQQQPHDWPTAIASAAPFHTSPLLSEPPRQPTPAYLATAAAGGMRAMPGEGCGGAAGAAAMATDATDGGVSGAAAMVTDATDGVEEQGAAGGASSQGGAAPQHMRAGMEGMLVASEGAADGLLPPASGQHTQMQGSGQHAQMPGSGQHAQMPQVHQQVHQWQVQDGAQSGSPVCSREAMPPPIARMACAPPPASPVCSGQLGVGSDPQQQQPQWGSPSKLLFQATQAMPGYGGTQHLAFTPDKQHGRPPQQQQQQQEHQEHPACRLGTPASPAGGVPELREVAGAAREDEGMAMDEHTAQGQAAEEQAVQGGEVTSVEDRGAVGEEGRSKEAHHDQGGVHAGAGVDVRMGEEGGVQEGAESEKREGGALPADGRVDQQGDAVMQGEHRDHDAAQLKGSVAEHAGLAGHGEGGSPGVRRGLDFGGDSPQAVHKGDDVEGTTKQHPQGERQEVLVGGATPQHQQHQQQQQQQEAVSSGKPTPSPLRSPSKQFRLSMSRVARGTPTHGTPSAQHSRDTEAAPAEQQMVPAEECWEGLQQQQEEQEGPYKRSRSPAAAVNEHQEGQPLECAQRSEGQPREGEPAEGSGDEGLPAAWGMEGQGREAGISQLGMPLADISQEHQNVQLPRKAGTPSQEKGGQHMGLSGELPPGSFPAA